MSRGSFITIAVVTFIIAIFFGVAVIPASAVDNLIHSNSTPTTTNTGHLTSNDGLDFQIPFQVPSRWGNFVVKDGKFVAEDNDTWFVYGWFGAIESNKSVPGMYALFGNKHQGIDFAARYGLSVVASEKGKVSYADTYYGNTVMIEHSNGITTVYGHLSEIDAKVGQDVMRGQEIGKVGNSGTTNPHLHFEVRQTIDNQLWLINPKKILTDVDWSKIVIPTEFPANRFYEGKSEDDQGDILWPSTKS